MLAGGNQIGKIFQEEFRKKFVNFFVLDGFVLDFVNSE